MYPIFEAEQKDGVLKVFNADTFRIHLRSFGEQKFDIIARKKRKERSNPQNRYYHGVVLEILSLETGHTKDELHDAFKRMFIRSYNDKGIDFIPSTTELSTVEFNEYFEEIRRFAARELKTVIPDPGEIE